MRYGLFAAVSLLCLANCSSIGSLHDTADKVKAGDFKHLDPIDPTLDLSRDDYKHMSAPKGGQEPLKVHIDQSIPPIPRLADILAAPRPPKIGETQLVSIAVTDDVPLKDVLLELSKLANVDVELDAGITGGIEFIAKDRPFNEVIDRICDLAGLRYTMHGNVLRVERDTSYIKSYSIDFLNLDRDSDSSVSLSTNVLSSGGSSSGGGGGGGLTTGSTSSVKSKTTGDFWKSLENGVTQILAYQAPTHVSETTLQSEEANTLTAVTGAAGNAGQPPEANAAGAAAPAGAAGGGKPIAKAAAPASAPAPVAQQSANAAGAPATAGKNYTINRQAGVLTVDASNRQHELIEKLLDTLKRNASAQVLIEAKILEVDLSDGYQSGVDWQAIGGNIKAAANFNTVGNALPSPLNSGTPTANVVSFATNDAKNLLSLVEAYGTTRTLSSPRLHAINNQQSTLTFATNEVYFQLTISTTTNLTTTTGTAPTQTTVNSQIQTVPVGIMMTMMPSIDLDSNEVTLSVRPTLSSLAGEVPDPAVAFEAAQAGLPNLVSNIPVIQVRELDSTLKLKSGQTMVIGGLMQQSGTNNDSGVPFISGIPVIGNLFKSVSKSSTNKELVLLIRATIVDTGGSMNNVEKNLFHKFSDDPRPVSF